MRKRHVKAALLLFCFHPCGMNLFLFFLLQSLQAITTGRNCQLDNAEESVHVITKIVIGIILIKRWPQVNSVRQLNFPFALRWLISCGKKNRFLDFFCFDF